MFKDYKTEVEKYSYCLGLDVVSRVKGLPVEVNVKAFLDAAETLLSGKKPDISQEEFDKNMGHLYQQLEQLKREHEDHNSKAKEEGDAYRAENAKKEGVLVTETGLQVEVLVEGKGAMPKATDSVKVHYEGTLIDGRVFDSSYERKEPIVFPLNQVIPGWTEGLQLAKVGSKLRLVIPPELAYGERGAGQDIPPYSTLVFTVELLDIIK